LYLIVLFLTHNFFNYYFISLGPKNPQNMHQLIRTNHAIDKYPNPLLQHVDRHNIGAVRQDRASYRYTPVGMFPPPPLAHGYNIGIGNGNMY
jgi:hypothetical protein